ncbi:DUF6705 family protein [Chryseobacterium sp. VD8]|uniref:DUF6705 family protein n=1 Tax=Chryseobacterium sp. VD8 TaxID=3081254 RepID=UPI00301753F4
MKILSLFVLHITLLSCKAQQVLSLNGSVVNSPINSYFKDINNELDFYVGNWKANFQNKTMILKITKALHRPFEMLDKNYFQDQLIIRYEIKDINESVLQTTLNRSFTDQNDVKLLIESSGTESNGDIVNLLFAGGNCSVGIGEIILKKINNTQFYWSYYPGTTTRNDITCPPNLDYNIYLPETENLIFTKQ